MFSDRVGYILNVMIHLGLENATNYRTSSSIADNVNVPDSYLNKIIGELADMGYLETKKGPSGGVRLRNRPEEISMNQLLEDTEALVHNSKGDACCVPSRLKKCITEHWIDGFKTDVVGETTLDDVTTLLASP